MQLYTHPKCHNILVSDFDPCSNSNNLVGSERFYKDWLPFCSHLVLCRWGYMLGSLYFQRWAADEDDLIWLWVYEDIYGHLEQIQAQRVVDIIYLHCAWNAKRKNISIKAPHQLPLIFILDRQQSKLTGLTQPWLRCSRAYIYTEGVPEPNTSILFRCLSQPLFVIVKHLLLYYLYIYINIYISIYILFS